MCVPTGDGQLGAEELAKMMTHIGKSEHEAQRLLDDMDEVSKQT